MIRCRIMRSEYFGASYRRGSIKYNSRARTSKQLLIAPALMFCLSIFSGPSEARDLEKLAFLLTPAYLAQNFASVCASRQENFLSELDRGITGVMVFVAHVKTEVTIDMSENEAFQVRLLAANVARFEAKTILNSFKKDDRIESEKAFEEWCLNSVKPFVMNTIQLHDVKHSDFVQQLDAAKK